MNTFLSIFKAILITPVVFVVLLPYLVSGSISFSLKLKMIRYGISLPVFLCDPICQMSLVSINLKKIQIISLQCALIPVIDEVVDYEGLSEDELSDILNNYDYYQGNNSTVKLFCLIVEKLKQKNGLNKESFEEMLNSQLESKKQYDLNIDDSTLQKVIYNKGGASIFHLASICSGERKDGSKELFYQIGFWLQLIDDYGDKEIDISMNIRTIANCTDQTKYLELMSSTKKELLTLLNKYNAKPKGKILLLKNLELYERLLMR
jgi:hypothetical protein